MKELTVYTFDDVDGNPDQFSTMNYEEAKTYAKKNELKIIENNYEWQEAIPCFGQDYTIHEDEYPSIEMPEIGMRVVLKEIEIGMMASLPADEIGTVKAIEDQVIVIKMDKHHEVLDEWNNEVLIHLDWIDGSYGKTTDPKARLAMAFWDNVDGGRVEAGT